MMMTSIVVAALEYLLYVGVNMSSDASCNIELSVV